MSEQLREYAAREAEREFPGEEGFLYPTQFDLERNLAQHHRGEGAAWGILHLADRLNDPDVIEAGADALPGFPEGENAEHYRSVMRDCLAAMFAKIEEGNDE